MASFDKTSVAAPYSFEEIGRIRKAVTVCTLNKDALIPAQMNSQAKIKIWDATQGDLYRSYGQAVGPDAPGKEMFHIQHFSPAAWLIEDGEILYCTYTWESVLGHDDSSGTISEAG